MINLLNDSSGNEDDEDEPGVIGTGEPEVENRRQSVVCKSVVPMLQPSSILASDSLNDEDGDVDPGALAPAPHGLTGSSLGLVLHKPHGLSAGEVQAATEEGLPLALVPSDALTGARKKRIARIALPKETEAGRAAHAKASRLLRKCVAKLGGDPSQADRFSPSIYPRATGGSRDVYFTDSKTDIKYDSMIKVARMIKFSQGAAVVTDGVSSVGDVEERLPESRPAPVDERVAVTSTSKKSAQTEAPPTPASRDPLFLHGCTIEIKWPTTDGTTELLTGIVKYRRAASRQRRDGTTRGSTKYRLLFQGREPKAGIVTTWKRLRRRKYTVVEGTHNACRWSEAHEVALFRRHKSGESIGSISISLDQSQNACEQCLSRVGVRAESQTC